MDRSKESPTSKARLTRADLAIILFFALVVLVFFHDVLIGHNIFLDTNPYHYDPWRRYALAGELNYKSYRTDAFVTYFPRQMELSRSIRAGRFPLWNPYIFAGMPFFADPQTRVLYPISLALVPLDPLRAMGFDVAIHFLISMIGMYLFMRIIGATRTGSMVAAFGYGFSSFFYVRMGHSTFVATGSWIPFQFYAFELARQSQRRGGLLLLLFLVLGYLAGFPQVFAFGVTALVLYGIYLGIDTSGRRKQALAGNLKALLIPGVLALLVLSVQLVPFAELTRNSIGLGIDYQTMRDIYLAPPIIMLRSVIPNFFGNPVEGTDWSDLPREAIHPYNPDYALYCGVATFMLALAAIFFSRRSPRIRFFLLIVVLTIGLATSPLFLKVGYTLIPLLRISRISRISVISCFALSVLAGLALSFLSQGVDRRTRKRVAIVAIAVVLVVIVTLTVLSTAGDSIVKRYADKVKQVPETFWLKIHGVTRSGKIKEWAEQGEAGCRLWLSYLKRQTLRSIIYCLISAFLIVFFSFSGKKAGAGRRLVASLIVLFVLFDIASTAKTFYVSQVPGSLFECDGIVTLKSLLGKPGNWRMRSIHHKAEDIKVLPPNTNLIYRMQSLPGQCTIVPRGYVDLLDAFSGQELPKRLRGRELPLQPAEILVSELASTRYLVLSSYKTTYLSSPVFRVVGGLESTSSNLRMLTIGNETRLAFCPRFNRVLNVLMNLPRVRWLDLSVGFDCPRASPGDTLTFVLSCEGNSRQVTFKRSFDLCKDAGKWHDFRIDISPVSGSYTRIRMGQVLRARSKIKGLQAGWSGFDLVYDDCKVERTDKGYVIDLGETTNFVRARIRSDAREVPLDISLGGDHTRRLWISFPPHMPTRDVTIDVRERGSGSIVLRSDSLFHLLAVKDIYSGPAYSGLELIYDKDMFIYENQGAIERGICIRKDAVRIEEAEEVPVAHMPPVDRFGDLRCGNCKIVSYEPERIVLEVVNTEDGILLFQDIYYPGWKAYVDGEEVRLLRTKTGLRALELTSGKHMVVMEYEPQSLRVGLLLTCFGILLTIVYVRRSRT